MSLPFPVRFAIVHAIAELIGLGGVGALAVAIALSIGSDSPALAPAVIALGALEGAVVGTAQARLVREKLPSLRPAAWIGATIVGAVLAWALGMLPSMLLGGGEDGGAPPAELPRALELALAALLGAVAGPVLGGAQAIVVHRHARRAVRGCSRTRSRGPRACRSCSRRWGRCRPRGPTRRGSPWRSRRSRSRASSWARSRGSSSSA